MVKKGFLTGLLLFGIFFGAGNLIFPPALGVASGQDFWPAILGFCLSGVGLAIITLLLGTLTNGGYKTEMSEKFSPWFSLTFLVILYLTIGPLFAIPRTATVSFEIGVAPIVGHSPIALLCFTACFFAAAYYLAIRPNGILDSVGKILTPVFAFLILSLVVVGAIAYGNLESAKASADYAGKAFGSGVLAGYNTLDALAAVAFCLVATETLKKFGFKTKKEYLSTIWIVGIVTSLAFSILYIGLGFLGNKFPVPADILADPNVNKGAYVLSQASYKLFATVFTLIGFLIANLGLNAVITFSVPVLTLLYPIVIVIVLIILINKWLPLSKKGMSLTIGLVTLVSFVEVLAGQWQEKTLTQLVGFLPFHTISMGWLVPMLIGIVFSLVLSDKQKGQAFDLEKFEG
ncbi:TPA: branched-chain amino acid transport system II carrier protein [Streptococcus agalactiae]